MQYVQVRLSNGDRETVVWIEKKKGLKKGSRVELLPEQESWTVKDMYTVLSKEEFPTTTLLNSQYKAPQ